MIRQLDTSFGKTLYEAYLESISSCEPPRRLPAASRDAGLETRPEPFTQLGPERIFGSIRVFDDGEHLILFTVVEQVDRDLYRALKVSDMLDFQSYWDLPFAALCGSYIAELDNAFLIHAGEISQSLPVDEVDGHTFMQLEGVWANSSGRAGLKPLYISKLDEWSQRFRIKEHELTCAFRSREAWDTEFRLWIPQLELDLPQPYEPLVQYSRSCLSKTSKLELEFDRCSDMPRDSLDTKEQHELMEWEEDRVQCRGMGYKTDVLPQKGCRLEERGNGVILLKPDPWLRGRLGTIYCGEFKVFCGQLPEWLVLPKTRGKHLLDLEGWLQFSVKPN